MLIDQGDSKNLFVRSIIIPESILGTGALLSVRILDDVVINRIAAGEVIERPSSVVKELVENSIDAQAACIQIDIESGGKRLIRVRDNGIGMNSDDAFLSLERHATSKISTEKDLVCIKTMGFRGEALASIASISKMRLVTRHESDDAGMEILMEGGTLRHSGQIGAGTGTTIEVRNLFYNVPVRRKFLKSDEVESDYIRELVNRLALAHPQIAFKLTENGRSKLDSPPMQSVFDRIYGIYSKEVRDNLISVEFKVEESIIKGFIAKPPYSRSNMRSVITFVNGRPVKDKLVNASINRAFSSVIEKGKYPFAVLFLSVPFDEIDINVHPQKAEVRFSKPQLISGLILDGIYVALFGTPFKLPNHERVQWNRDSPEHDFKASTNTQFVGSIRKEYAEFKSENSTTSDAASVSSGPEMLRDERGRLSELGILGRIPNSFLLLHDEDSLVILDQHAAHERLLFERLRDADRRGERLESQGLLMPLIIELSSQESEVLREHIDILLSAGFDIEGFGEQAFLIRSVPQWMDEPDPEKFIIGMIDTVIETGLKGDLQSRKDDWFKMIACKAAIKEPNGVSREEIRHLLTNLDSSPVPETCPHGRPFVLRIPFGEIRRRMGR